MTPLNASFKDKDLELWNNWKRTKSATDRAELLKRFDSVIQSQVNRWSGPVPREVLVNEAKLLALKAFDNYDPNMGAALATHVTNNLAPLSRVVYTAQNTARLPENIVLKMHTYNAALDHLTNFHGRAPTVDELHEHTGWTVPEINRIETYNRKDLVESGSIGGDSFFNTYDDRDSDVLGAVYFDLSPDEKVLFDHVTGDHGKSRMKNPELCKKLGLTQAQLSYKKSQLTNKMQKLLTQGKFGHAG